MENKEVQKAKLEKFKAMGIPVPMEKPAFDQPVINVKDPKMLSRINEIRSGAKKNEFKEILSTGTPNQGFQPLPDTKAKKNPNAPAPSVKAPSLSNFSPVGGSSELALAESLFDDTPPVPQAPVRSSGNRMQESASVDATGTDFLKDFRSRLKSKASSGGFTQQNVANSNFQNESENPNALKSMVEAVAADVAKKVASETLKSVLNEYLSNRQEFAENTENTFKRIKDDIVLIEGRYFKLVPVKVKTKQ